LVPRSRGQHLELARGGREPPFSAELAAVVAGSLEALNASDVAREALAGAPLTVRDSIAAVFSASDFVAQSCARDPQVFAGLIESAGRRTGGWRRRRSRHNAQRS